MSTQSATSKLPDVMRPAGWMKPLLLSAGFYNLAWGALAILFPVAMLQTFGLEQAPRYPEFWQCLGMVIGVFGIGYMIAASDPFRHWPIVFVGFLGKIFGPIGVAYAIATSHLPSGMAVMSLLNDVIWWVPFAVILWQAAKANQADNSVIRIRPQSDQFDPIRHAASQYGQTMEELSRRKNLLVIFLRHSGCTFCRQALADVGRLRSEIEARGTTIALVHMGKQEPVDLLVKNNLEDVHCFRDPYNKLYEAFDLKLGRFRQLFGPKVWLAGIRAFWEGHGIGALEGNGFRMPGVFLLRDGKIVRAYRHESVADRPEYLLMTACDDAENGDISAQSDCQAEVTPEKLSST